jgi:hypothetical protein
MLVGGEGCGVFSSARAGVVASEFVCGLVGSTDTDDSGLASGRRMFSRGGTVVYTAAAKNRIVKSPASYKRTWNRWGLTSRKQA